MCCMCLLVGSPKISVHMIGISGWLHLKLLGSYTCELFCHHLVTGDKTWIYHWAPLSKLKFMGQWKDTFTQICNSAINSLDNDNSFCGIQTDWCTRINIVIYSHTHMPFNGPLSGTTWVSWYQKGKTNLDFTGARDSEWQWHQLGHMQVCTSLQTDNHASSPPLSFLQAGCPSCCPTNSVKALKAITVHTCRK